jgi:hypothetical protein
LQLALASPALAREASRVRAGKSARACDGWLPGALAAKRAQQRGSHFQGAALDVSTNPCVPNMGMTSSEQV